MSKGERVQAERHVLWGLVGHSKDVTFTLSDTGTWLGF